MTIAPIVFPDIELVLAAYLRAELARFGYPGVFVSNRRGTQDVAVWVRRDGGPAAQVTEDARVGVNVYAASETAVIDLAQKVSAILRAAPGHGPIKKVTQQLGPSPIPDASPRRYMTLEMRIKGTELRES